MSDLLTSRTNALRNAERETRMARLRIKELEAKLAKAEALCDGLDQMIRRIRDLLGNDRPIDAMKILDLYLDGKIPE